MEQQPEQKTEKSTRIESCYHCGEPCNAQPVRFDDHPFCCDGCRLVYEILSENNLCTYYQMGEGQGNSPNPDLYKDKFGYLDQPEIREQLLHFSSASQCHVNFFIPGMHCSSCIWLLENFRKLDNGVISSMVDFPGRTVHIAYNPAETSLSKMAARLAGIGYEPHISLDSAENKGRKSVNRMKWARIGVAGFCFGNIMMLSFPEYFSVGSLEDFTRLSKLFVWLNLLLSLPVLFFSSRDFFVSAYGAIKARYLNIDLPVAAAVLITFIRSVYELISGTGPGYFDSMAGIVFFMLIGRAFQDRTFETLAFDRDYKSYFPLAVSLIEGQGERPIQVSALEKGMHIRIRNNEVIPADALLLSEDASIDYSFVTGESRPEQLSRGTLVYAGGRQKGAAIELEVLKPVEQSYLTRLWNNKAFDSNDQDLGPESGMVNKINQYFTGIVFVLAALSASYWYFQSEPLRAWNAVTTILIVACPCILLLAATFTNGHVLRILGRNGLYLKHARVIERLGKADTLVFDKTGTITPGSDSLPEYSGKPLNSEQKSALAALVAQSNHPLSRRIAASLKLSATAKVHHFEEVSGKGLSGTIQNSIYELGAAAYTGAEQIDDTQTSVFLSIDKIPWGRFIFRNQIREGLGDQLEILNHEHELYLLSGDHAGDRTWLGRWFKPEHMHFRFQPEDKLNFVKELRAHGKVTLMLGDGLNDAGALRESDVGIAVSEDVNNFSPACDGIMQGEGMGRLNDLIRFCKKAKKIIGWSFAISIVYNIIGLSFALRGELQPVIAAILMPSASISIVGIATLLTWMSARRLKLT